MTPRKPSAKTSQASDSLLERLGSAAQYFWFRTPWQTITEAQAPLVKAPSGRTWTASVLGATVELQGLALYADRDEFFALHTPLSADPPIRLHPGHAILLLLPSTGVTPEEVLQNVRAHGMSGIQAAVPNVMVVTDDPGGLTGEEASDASAILYDMATFVQHFGPALVREERTGRPFRLGLEANETPHGCTIRYRGEGALIRGSKPPVSRPRFSDMRNPWIDESRRGRRGLSTERLITATMRGPRSARSSSAEGLRDDLGDLTPDQVASLLRSDWSSRASSVRLSTQVAFDEVAESDLFFNAHAMLTLARESDGLLATPRGRLRIAVVAELMKRMRLPSWVARTTEGLRRIDETQVSTMVEARLHLGAAGLIVGRGNRFELTRNGRTAARPENAGLLYAALVRGYFRRFNFAYRDLWDWPELQTQAAYTLFRLPKVAAHWRTGASLTSEVVLPAARDVSPMDHSMDLDTLLLEKQILDPLVRFGLVQRTVRTSLFEDVRYRVSRLYRRVFEFNV